VYIYVQSSLLTQYQNATNWVYFSSYFSAIGGDILPDGLISFKIDTTRYLAEDGMRWYDWLESPYNTDGYAADLFGNVLGNTGKYVREIDGTEVSFEELIKSDYNYTLDY
jgi:hypothetical protein